MNRDYNYRRHHRERMIQRRFRFYYYLCDDRQLWQRSHYAGYERCIVGKKRKWKLQRENQATILMWAKMTADNRKVCSCYMCGGYHRYERSFQRRRLDEAMDSNKFP